MSRRHGIQTRGIYAITNRANGHQYIGSSVFIERRWDKHREDLESGKHHSRILLRAWEKWGPERFDWTVLQVVPEDEDLLASEREWQERLKPAYNGIAPDRSLQGRHSIKSRVLMSEGQHRYWVRRWASGRGGHTEESRAKIGAAHRGKPETDETRKILSEAAKRRHAREGYRTWTHCRNGHEFTPDNVKMVDGHRTCLTCYRTRTAAWMRQKRAKGRTTA